MKPTPRKSLVCSLALAAAVLVSACGGGSPGAPDVFPPRVESIVSDASGVATGPVTFTFTFSEDVGSSFTVDDLTVAGGTPGALTRVSATQYTLVVTPPGAAAGTIEVTLSGSVSDRAGNVSTVNPTVAVAFNTVAPGASGHTGTCTGSCIDFAGAAVKYAAFEGLVSAGQANDPADATNKVARLVKGPAGQPWAGATIYTVDATQSVPAFDLTASKVVTLRVYAPAAGIPIMLKLEDAANAGVFVEKIVNTTRANAWETLSFDFGDPSNGSHDPAGTYNRVSVFPNFLVAETSQRAYYFDELNYTAVVVGGGGGTLTFSSGFAGANRTVEGGAYFAYSGSDLDSFNCTGGPAWCGSGDGGSGDTSFFFAYYQTPSPATALYNGISVLAPGVTAISDSGDTPGVQLSGQSTINFTFNNNPEWQASGTNNFGVLLTLGKFYDLDPGAGVTPCNIKLLAVVTPLNNGAAAPYSVPLSAFQVIQACNSGIATVADALASAPVSEVAFQAAGGGAALPTVGGKTTGANFTVATGGVYPTTLALTGGISFE